LLQMVEPLRADNIELDVRPFLDESAFASLYRKHALASTVVAIIRGLLGRLRDVVAARRSDVVLVQREAAIVGPPLIELLIQKVARRPIVLDLDDPTWISYDSPTFGPASRLAKWPSKTDALIDRAAVVTCGGPTIASHVEDRGRLARVIPTVVDTELFRPAERAQRAMPVVGWIGSHSTYPYLVEIVPSLEAAASRTQFALLVVGAPDGAELEVADVDVEMRPWSLAREVDDFRSIDIGLYPLGHDAWARGKSGFKAIQYLAVGIPFVATPVGAAAEIGSVNETHLEAMTPADWVEALVLLCSDPTRRERMGRAGRQHSLSHYTVGQMASKLAAALREAAG
jgi:glycosyltransferase involved in cell wall biosynthesis